MKLKEVLGVISFTQHVHLYHFPSDKFLIFNMDHYGDDHRIDEFLNHQVSYISAAGDNSIRVEVL